MRRTTLHALFIGSICSSLALLLLLHAGRGPAAVTILLYGYVIVAAVTGLVGYRKRVLEHEHGRHPSLRETVHDLVAVVWRGIREGFKRSDDELWYEPVPAAPDRGDRDNRLHLRRGGTGHAG